MNPHVGADSRGYMLCPESTVTIGVGESAEQQQPLAIRFAFGATAVGPQRRRCRSLPLARRTTLRHHRYDGDRPRRAGQP